MRLFSNFFIIAFNCYDTLTYGKNYTFCSTCSSFSNGFLPYCVSDVRINALPDLSQTVRISLENFAILCVSEVDLAESLSKTFPNSAQVQTIITETSEFKTELLNIFKKKLGSILLSIGNVTIKPANFDKASK